jgi:hypothetical protein
VDQVDSSEEAHKAIPKPKKPAKQRALWITNLASQKHQGKQNAIATPQSNSNHKQITFAWRWWLHHFH